MLLISHQVATLYKKKQTKVTNSPKIATFPRFWKNFFFLILNPELKITGGRKKLKNADAENSNYSFLLWSYINQNISAIAIPKRMVTPVSCPKIGLTFSKYP